MEFKLVIYYITLSVYCNYVVYLKTAQDIPVVSSKRMLIFFVSSGSI